MDYAAQRVVIESAFSTSWATATPIAWENVAYEPTPSTQFVSLRILPSNVNRRNIGQANALYRYFGIVEIVIYVPKNTGMATAYDLADRAIAIFRDNNLDSVHFREGKIQDKFDMEEWVGIIITVPYFNDEIT